MALYKYSTHLTKSDHAAFDEQQEPGTKTDNAGVYRCVACGYEIGIAKGHTLPPQNHHQHAVGLGRIRWQLVVYAQSKG
jgi:hypothetical protein